MKVFEAIRSLAGLYAVSAQTCKSWVYTNSLSHRVLRDNGGKNSLQTQLSIQSYDVVVLDRYLKIVHKGSAYSPTGKRSLLAALGKL